MDAGEVLAVFAGVLVGRGVVFGRGADGIGELLRRRAQRAGTDARPSRGIGDLATETAEEAVVTEASLGHQIVAGDDFVGLVGGGEPVLLVEVFVFLPERGIRGLALLNDLSGLDDRDLAAGLNGVPHEDGRIGGQRGAANIAPAAVAALEFDRVVANGGTGFQEGGELLDGQLVFEVGARLADEIDVEVARLSAQAVDGGAPVVGVGEIEAAVLDEARVKIALGAVENPAHAGLTVGADDVVEGACGGAGDVVAATVGTDQRDVAEAIDERAFGAEVAVARAAEKTGPIDFQATKGVLTGQVHVTEALVAVDEIGRDVDQGGSRGAGGGIGGRGNGADGRDAIGPARDDTARGGVGNGGLRSGEGAHLVLAAHGLGGIVVDEVELEDRVTTQAIVPLGVNRTLLAVVVVVLSAVIPQVGRLGVGLLVVAVGAEEAEGVFRVESVDRDGEVFDFAAENGELLHVGAIEEGVVAAGFAQRYLLGEPRGGAGGQTVAHAALFLHGERRTSLEIHAATKGVDGLVRRLALDEFERLKHGAGEGGHAGVAVLGAEGRHAAAVDGDGAHAGAHAADADDFDDFVAGVTERDAREANREFGRVHVGKVDQGVHGRDILKIVGVALLGERGGDAFLLAGDLEGIENEDAAGHDEVAHGGLPGGDVDGDPLGLEAGVSHHEFVSAGGHVEPVAAGVVHERAEI